MSIDLNWEALTTGPDGEALRLRVRDFIHERFQTVQLPRFIKSVAVHDFAFGTVPPRIELRDVTDPLPDFYEENEAADEADLGEDDDYDDEDESGEDEYYSDGEQDHLAGPGRWMTGGGADSAPDVSGRRQGEQLPPQQRAGGGLHSKRGPRTHTSGTGKGHDRLAGLDLASARLASTYRAPRKGDGAGGLRMTSDLASSSSHHHNHFHHHHLGVSTPGFGPSGLSYFHSHMGHHSGVSGGGPHTPTPLMPWQQQQQQQSQPADHQYPQHSHGHNHASHSRNPSMSSVVSDDGAGVGRYQEAGTNIPGAYPSSYVPPPPADVVHPLREKHSVSTMAPTSSRPGTRDGPRRPSAGGVASPSVAKGAAVAGVNESAIAETTSGSEEDDPRSSPRRRQSSQLKQPGLHSRRRRSSLRSRQIVATAAKQPESADDDGVGRGGLTATDQQQREGKDAAARQSHELGGQGNDEPEQRRGRRRRPPSPHPEDLQAVFRIRYSGDVRLTLTANILLDYPMPSFVGIPLRLTMTGLRFDGVGVLAHVRKRRVHFCFLGPEDAALAVSGADQGLDDDEDEEDGDEGGDGRGRGQSQGQERRRIGGLIQEIKVESEIGQREGGKSSLKNVGKVERFVLEQVRRIFEEELVYPSFWTFLV